MTDFKSKVTAQHSVHPNPGKVRRGHGGGSRRVFKQFAWLEVGSVKAALPRHAWWLSLSKPTSTPTGHNASRSAIDI